jgi:uncharacterized protein
MTRTRKMWLLALFLVPLLLYLAVLTALYLAQTSLLFPSSHVGAPGPLPQRTERLELVTASGVRLRGLRVPPSGGRGGEHTLILGFGGNAASASDTTALLHYLFPDAEVVSFYYRGYPPSGGEAGAAALKEDALQLYDSMRERLQPARTIAVGFSVGGGIAASLAAHRPLDGLILVTPFDSLAGVAASHYPWVPVRLLLRHELEPARDLAGVDTPVAIIAGGRDELVPAARTRALRAALARLVFDRTIAAAGHNDMYVQPVFHEAMRAARQRIEESSRAN